MLSGWNAIGNQLSPNGFILIFFSILIGIFLMAMPKYHDDYSYLQTLTDWFHDQDIPDATEGGDIFRAGFPLRGIADSWELRWNYDNTRLGNMLGVVMLLFPKWLGSLLSLIAWVFSMVASFTIAGVKIRNSALVSLGIILWGVFVPWNSHNGCLIFQYNYILSTGVTLGLLLLLGSGRGKAAVCFIYGMVVGAWHEAFSIPVLVGLGVSAVCFTTCRRQRIYWAMAGLAIGIAVLASAPGTAIRITGIPTKFAPQKINLLLFNLPYFLFLVLTFYKGIRNGWKEVLEKLIVFCLASGAIPIMMSCVTVLEARVTWWSQIVAVIGILTLLAEYNRSYWDRYRLGNLIWLCPCLLTVFIRFAVADVYAVRFHRLMSGAISSYRANPGVPVFTDVKPVDNLPFVAFKLPEVIIWGEMREQVRFLSAWSGERDFKILPSELRNVTGASGRQLEGDAGVREYKGALFTPVEGKDWPDYELIWFEADYDGRKRRSKAYVMKFFSEADGKEYYYLYHIGPWVEGHFMTLRGLNSI